MVGLKGSTLKVYNACFLNCVYPHTAIDIKYGKFSINVVNIPNMNNPQLCKSPTI